MELCTYSWFVMDWLLYLIDIFKLYTLKFRDGYGYEYDFGYGCQPMLADLSWFSQKYAVERHNTVQSEEGKDYRRA